MPSISHRYVQIAEEIAERVRLPRIQEIYLPSPAEDPECKQKFGAVILEDGSAGIMFILNNDTTKQLHQELDVSQYHGRDPLLPARFFTSSEPAHKTLAMGTLNAISQFLLRRSGYSLDHTTDSLALFEPRPGDAIGMVGFFPPLVNRIREAEIELIVIELKEELARREPGLLVTTDARELRHCTKVLCTSTVLLNETLDDILENCRQAERVAIIGPTAGFLPDALFERGVDTIGGTSISDAEGFLAHSRRREKWGTTAQKYCIQKGRYPGYSALLAGIDTSG